MQNRSIWIYRIGALGDALVCVPAIQYIQRLNPDARLVLLTDTQSAGVTSAWEILQHLGVFDGVVFYRPKRIVDILNIAASLRRQRVATLYYLAPYRSRVQRARDWLFFRVFGGVRAIIGLNRGYPEAGTRSTRRFGSAVVKESERLLAIANEGEEVTPKILSNIILSVPTTYWDKIAPTLNQAGWRQDQRLLALGPGSKMQAKRWPMGRYAELGGRLLRKHSDVFLVVLGSKEESALGRQLCDAWGERCANLAGSATLMHAAAVLRHSELYIGNDTGTMHLAAAVGTVCVAIFSARDKPGKWDPFGDGHRVLRADVPCAGCMLTSCIDLDQECLKRITVDRVEAEVNEALTTTTSRQEVSLA